MNEPDNNFQLKLATEPNITADLGESQRLAKAQDLISQGLFKFCEHSSSTVPSEQLEVIDWLLNSDNINERKSQEYFQLKEKNSLTFTTDEQDLKTLAEARKVIKQAFFKQKNKNKSIISDDLDENGNTILHIAIENIYQKGASPEVALRLIAKGVSLTVKNKRNMDALQLALQVQKRIKGHGLSPVVLEQKEADIQKIIDAIKNKHAESAENKRVINL